MNDVFLERTQGIISDVFKVKKKKKTINWGLMYH